MGVDDQTKLSKSGTLHRDRTVVDFVSCLRSDGSRTGTTRRSSWKSAQLAKSLDSTSGMMKSSSDGSLGIDRSAVDFIGTLRSDGANESDRASQQRVARETAGVGAVSGQSWKRRTPSKTGRGREPSESSGPTDCAHKSAVVTTETRDVDDDACVDSAHVGSGFRAVRKLKRSPSSVSDCSTSASPRQADCSPSPQHSFACWLRAESLTLKKENHETNLGEALAQ